MQINTTVRYHLTWARMTIIKKKKSVNNKCWRGCGEKETSITVSGDVNWCSHYGEQYGGSLKKLEIELLCDPEIPLPGTYPEKIIIWKNICTPMFIAALFTIARIWKQPKCPSEEERIKKMWYIYSMGYYSATKK